MKHKKKHHENLDIYVGRKNQLKTVILRYRRYSTVIKQETKQKK